MATPVLNNGIFYREMNYSLNSRFIDEYHVSSILSETQPTDLGPVAIYAMARYRQSPLYNLALINKKNYITVTDEQGRYMWEVPIPYELPQIVEDIEPTNVQKGKFGTSFRLKFNRPDFGPGAIITCDNFNGPEVYIVDTPVQTSNGWVYTCKLASNMNTNAFLDNQYVQPGIKWNKKTSAYNSWSTKFQGVNYVGGVRKYYNYAPKHQVGVEMHVTEDMLEKIKLTGVNGKFIQMVELFQINDPKLYDPGVNSVAELSNKLGGEKGLRKAVADGRINMMLLTKIEADMLKTLQLDIESELMWGQGGRLTNENQGTIVRTPGLWRQFDLGYKRVYDYKTFSMKIIRDVLQNFFIGHEPFEPNDPSRTVIIETGVGGLRLVNDAIAAEASATGFAIQAAGANSIGAISGDRMNLQYGFNYSSYIFPNLAKVYFRLNPALDAYNANDITNPLINGHRLSSYSFLIFDIGDNLANNIRFLKYYASEGPKWIYKNGTCDYKGSNVVISGGDFNGYKLTIRQYVPGIHVMDPTRVAKIVMRNPITGQTL